ncbi:hypothetical protein ACFL5V_01370 [Fibrobacterota bacterium]
MNCLLSKYRGFPLVLITLSAMVPGLTQIPDAGDFYCETYLELRDSLQIKHDSAQIPGLLEKTRMLAESGDCEQALDLLSSWEVEGEPEKERTALESQEDLKELESLLEKTIRDAEALKKDSLPEKPQRTFDNIIAMQADYYGSDEEDLELEYDPSDPDSSNVIPGTRDLTYGSEYVFKTRNANSFFRYTYNKLTVLNEYLYERLENDFGGELFNGNMNLNLNSIVGVKQNHTDNATSFRNIIFKPGAFFQSRASYRIGLNYTGEIKRHNHQKSGYEDFTKALVQATYAYMGERTDLDVDLAGSRKRFPDSTENNYTLRGLTLDWRYFLNDNASLELFYSREYLTYINYPLGPDKENSRTIEVLLSLLPAAGSINLLFRSETIDYTQFDSIPTLNDTAKTLYATIRTGLEPGLAFSFTKYFSMEAGLKGELLNLKLRQRLNMLLSTYFVPKEDSYLNMGWSFFLRYEKKSLDGSLGLEYDFIDYTSGAEAANTDIKSLMMHAYLFYPFTGKLNLSLDIEIPFPGFQEQNSIEDRSLFAELAYRF